MDLFGKELKRYYQPFFIIKFHTGEQPVPRGIGQLTFSSVGYAGKIQENHVHARLVARYELG